MNLRAGLILDRDVVECAGQVIGTVQWSGNRGRRRVGVVLRYRTGGSGQRDAATVKSADLGTSEAGEARFQLTVPARGPITYHGQLIHLIWQVAVQVPPSQRYGRSGPAAVDLTVVPRGWLRLPEALRPLPPA